MKKIIKFLIINTLILFTLTACHDPIFYSIMNDVPPEESTVSGVVNCITRYSVNDSEFLVINANDGLKYKKLNENQHGKWITYKNIPFSLHHYEYYGAGHVGHQLIKVVADSETLYLISVEYTNDEIEGIVAPKAAHIWAKTMTLDTNGNWDTTGNWTEITGKRSDDKELLQFYKSGDLYYSSFNVFSTNSPIKTHRNVFIKSQVSSTEYWKLENKTLSNVTSTVTANVKDSDNTTDVDGASYIGNTIYFFNTSALCSNETYTSNATKIYFGKENTDELYYFDGSSVSSKILNVGEDISCMAVTKDFLLIGRSSAKDESSTSGGIVKTALNDDGTPKNSLSSFSTNAQTQLSSSYIIYTLLAADPSLNETEGALYSSIGFKGSGNSTAVNFSNIGLWSYYPSRGNWNRE